MFKKIIPYLFFLICLQDLFAINTYPFKIEFLSVERGGKLIPKLENKILKNYFFKPAWAGNIDIYSSWEGLNKDNIKLFKVENINILGIELYHCSFLLIFEQNGKIFVALADTNFVMKQINEIHLSQNNYDLSNISLKKISENIFSLLLNNNLFQITLSNENIYLQFISANVLTHPVYLDEKIYFIKKNQFFQELRVFYQKNDKIVLRLQLPDYLKLIRIKNDLILISGSRYADNSWVFLIQDNKIKSKLNFQTSPEKMIFFSKNEKIYCYFLDYDNFEYYLNICEIVYNSFKVLEQVELSRSITDLIKLEIINDEIYLLFKNSLVIVDLTGKIKAINYFPFTEYFNDEPQIFAIKNLIYISDFSNSLILKKIENKYWLIYHYYDKLGNYTVIVFLILITLYIYRKYLKQKLISRTLLDLPSSGVVFIVDKNGRLIRINDTAKNLLNITKDVPLKRLFTFYCDEKTEKLNNLVAKAIVMKEGFRDEIKIIDDEKFTEWVFSVYPLNNLFGSIVSYIITGINITEEIERKRIYNWAQLAHDMQTNLSTIKLNAEQLKCSDNDDISRKKKILVQTNILIHKVRDILTVGRSDELNLSITNSAEICKSVKEEFDESLFPNIRLNFDCENFDFRCDKPKILRALRNTIENAIKAIKDKDGKINITIWHDIKYVYFSVKDNGIGMTEKQLMNIKKPFYTSSTKEGGSGIGTMIIQNVVEQHGGELKYSSKIGEGTEVTIKIPYLNGNK